MLIPEPKILKELPGILKLTGGGVRKFDISSGSRAEAATVKVIHQELRRITGVCGGAPVQVKWRQGAVESPHIPEQAYELKISADGINIRANTAIGALYGVSALRQLKKGPGIFQQVEIKDWPDVEIRIAGRPLLCAETRGSALDWGDGVRGFVRRWKEEIDFALRFRYNAFFAYGFSWDTSPFPEFGRCFKIINAYARARGVKLTFGGLGISKNDTGTVRILADADRRSSGLGAAVKQTWPCSRVDVHQRPDVYCGTCRSNVAIRTQKIRDLAAFVQAVEPALLYIHHEDLNTIDETQQQFWDCRCPECRKKWPDDRMEALHGGAGAVADTMNAYSEALLSLPESPTGYLAGRDCVILYTSPGYGDWSENSEQWQRVKTLWCNVVRQLKHPEHFAISVREQFRNENTPELRIKELSEQIRCIAPSCGLHVFVAGGADLYYNNAPFCSTPEMFSACNGARAVFAFNGILFQRPQLAFNAECLWNTGIRAGGCVKDLPPTRIECNQRLNELIAGPLPEEYRHQGSWLAKACRELYGKNAGDEIFRYQLLRSPSGCYPLSILYYEMRMRRKLFRIMDNPATDRPAEAAYWQETLDITQVGREIIAGVRRHSEVSAALRRELEHQEQSLEYGIMLAKAAVAFFRNQRRQYAAAVKQFSAAVKEMPSKFIAPEEGDAGLYAEYAAGLQQRLQNWTSPTTIPNSKEL